MCFIGDENLFLTVLEPRKCRLQALLGFSESLCLCSQASALHMMKVRFSITLYMRALPHDLITSQKLHRLESLVVKLCKWVLDHTCLIYTSKFCQIGAGNHYASYIPSGIHRMLAAWHKRCVSSLFLILALIGGSFKSHCTALPHIGLLLMRSHNFA